MTDLELLKNIQSDDDEQELLQDAKVQLDAELRKPSDQRDYDVIDELTKRIALLNGTSESIKKRSQTGIRLMQAEMRKQSRAASVKRAYIVLPGALAIVILLSNALTISAFGTNVFSAVYRIITGGVTVDFSKETEAVQDEGNAYYDEMKQLCEEHEMPARIPAYIPAGFMPTDIYGEFIDSPVKNTAYYYFKRKKEKLQFQFTEPKDDSAYQIGIPSEHHNITEQEIKGVTVHVVKEDAQYTAVFMIDDIQYFMFAEGLDYDECQKVLESMIQ